MSEPISEYTVRDYSAVDEQVKQIAERERIVTQKLKLENVKRALFLACAALLAIAIFIFIAAIAYRIAFPPEPKIIEKVEIVEKVIEPQKIIIQTPTGSTAEKSNVVPAQKEQSLSKFFGKSGNGISNEVSGSTGTSVVGNSSGKKEPSNSKVNENNAESSTGLKRTVHTFTTINARPHGFVHVVTGWRWGKVTDDEPEYQYCYAERRASGKRESFDLARIDEPGQEVFNIKYNSKSNVSRSTWGKLIESCRWFSR